MTEHGRAGTKLEVASAVSCRFDVRRLEGDSLISSLEIFSALVDEAGIHDGGLMNVKVHPGSAAAVERYRPLFEKVWRWQWEREVE